MVTMIEMEFSEWLNQKYIDWRGESRGTISEFAEFVGVRQPVMSSWMKRGGKAPGASSLAKIASKLGLEVYEVLGLPSPTVTSLMQLPPPYRDRIQAALAEVNAQYASRHISADSPEALAVVAEVFAKFGFTVTQTVNE